MLRLAAAALLLVAAGAASAQADGDASVLVRDVPVGASGMGGPGSGPFTLVSLRDGRIVPNADSASTAWDLGLRGTSIILNGGASGLGAAAAVFVNAPFDAVTAPPADSAFVTDGERPCPRGAATAVCSGSGNGWYVYEASSILPVPDQTLVVRLAEGGAAKVRFVSYYRGAPDEPGATEPRFYTLEVAPLPAP